MGGGGGGEGALGMGVGGAIGARTGGILTPSPEADYLANQPSILF